ELRVLSSLPLRASNQRRPASHQTVLTRILAKILTGSTVRVNNPPLSRPLPPPTQEATAVKPWGSTQEHLAPLAVANGVPYNAAPCNRRGREPPFTPSVAVSIKPRPRF